MAKRVAISVFFMGVAACSSSSEGAPDPSTTPAGCTDGAPGCVGWNECPPELAKDEENGGCREILPRAECAPGAMPVLGSATCVPVGPTACPDGFSVAKAGWGCEVTIPPAACTGATRDEIGKSTCVPVGDCNAPFPPAGATHFVNAAYTDAEVDATHFKTIAAAITAAPSGATIAIESGTYAEGINAPRAVNVVGRCAANVKLVGTGLEVWGVYTAAKNVKVSGVTLEDHYEGVRAQGGGQVTITDSVIEAPRSSGLIAYLPNSLIRAERVVIRNVKPHATKQSAPVFSANADEGGTIELVSSSVAKSWEAGVVATNPTDTQHTSTVSLSRTIVRDTNLGVKGTAGAAVVVSDHSKGEVTESVITDVKRLGLVAIGAPASLSATSTIVQRTLEDDIADGSGAGAYAIEGASITLTDSSIRESAQSGVFAIGKNTKVSLVRSVVYGTKPSRVDGEFGMGAWAQSGAELAFDTTALVGNAYYGVSLVDSRTKGTFTNVLVKDTRTNRSVNLGRGLNMEYGATATAEKMTVLGSGDEGVFVRGEAKDGARSRLTAKSLYVGDMVGGKDDRSGAAVVVESGGILELDTGLISRAIAVGLALNETAGDRGNFSEATIAHLIVRDTLGGNDAKVSNSEDGLSGTGILALGNLSIRASAVYASRQFGIIAGNPTGSATIANCIVADTLPGTNTNTYGHGIVAMSSALLVKDSVVRGNQAGLAFDRSAGIVSDVLVKGNAVGIHVQGEGYSLVTSPTAPEAPEGNTVIVTDSSRFVDNATRVGSGVLPLPTVSVAP